MYKKIVSGTEEKVTEAILEFFINCTLQDSFKTTCFDTANNNIENKNGSGVVNENKLRKILLALTCKHQINKIMVSDVFKKCYSDSKESDILLYKYFKKLLKEISRQNLKLAVQSCHG